MYKLCQVFKQTKWLLFLTLSTHADCLHLPTDLEAGICYEKEENSNLAQAAYERCIINDTNSSQARLKLADLYISMQMPQVASAVAQKIDNASNKTSFDSEFKLLVQTFASMKNGCHFCHDFRLTLAIKGQLGTEKFVALENYKTSNLFNKREQAAFAYVEEATTDKHVSEETFSNLMKYFTDVEIVELTWINAAENYYNSLMIPLGIESDGLRQIALQKGS